MWQCFPCFASFATAVVGSDYDQDRAREDSFQKFCRAQFPLMVGLLPAVPVGHAPHCPARLGRRAARGWHLSCRAQGQESQPRAAEAAEKPEQPASTDSLAAPPEPVRRQAVKTPQPLQSGDWVATQLTRRFGLVGGLAWLGLLTFGVVSEQIKTRRELAEEEAGTKDVDQVKEVVTPDGLRYRDLKVGGGATPQRGFIVVLDFKASADGKVFEDTKARGKPIVFLYKARPFTGGLCEGVERALANMRAGGKRVVTVPPELGFGASGTVLRPTEHVPDKAGMVPPNAALEYELQLVSVSIPPS